MPDGDNETPPVAVTVETAPAEPVSTVNADAVLADAAAQSAVLAAGTAIALAEGQAAEVQADAARTVAEVVEGQEEWHARVAMLETRLAEMQADSLRLQTDMSTLIQALEEFSTRQPSPPTIPAEEAIAVTEPAAVQAEPSNQSVEGVPQEAAKARRYRLI